MLSFKQHLQFSFDFFFNKMKNKKKSTNCRQNVCQRKCDRNIVFCVRMSMHSRDLRSFQFECLAIRQR